MPVKEAAVAPPKNTLLIWGYIKGVNRMSKESIANKYKTTVHTNENGENVVTYYETDIVRYNDAQIFLDTGTHKSRTTKSRMNMASQEFDLGYRIYQKGEHWYIAYQNQVHYFDAHQIRLDRKNGTVHQQ